MGTALDAAVLVFRERGYHAASLADLGTAMKLTPGSIYKAFSDKRAIFLAALERYVELRNLKLRTLLEAESTGLGKLRAMLCDYADLSHHDEGRRGCLVVVAATELTTFDDELAGRVKAALQHVESSVRRLIETGQADGSIPRSVDSAAAGLALTSMLQGLRVLGKAGRSRAELLAAANQALRLLA